MFLLGTHHPHWLGLTDVPLFVSVSTLRKRVKMPKARGPWGQDSSGFTMLRDHGEWTFTPRTYADDSRRIADGAGMPILISIMDYMCEPIILAKTGKTVAEHQALTIESFLTLRELDPELPWMPVLQGWECDDYLHHIEMYASAGVDLTAEPIVGVGTICKRQSSKRAARIIRAIALQRIRIHAFGVKADGIRMYGDWIVSADSMAWSFGARRRKILLPECAFENKSKPPKRQHQNCANCIKYAMRWREQVVSTCPAHSRPAMHQIELPYGAFA